MTIPTKKVKLLSGAIVIINADEVASNPLYAPAKSDEYDFAEVKPKKGKADDKADDKTDEDPEPTS